MSGPTSIEWTNRSWNPVTGCTEVSPGCDHCYARAIAERFRGVNGNAYEQGFDLKLWPGRLNLPLQWKKPQMIFVNSMSDLFHKDIPDEYIAQVFDVMNRASHHIFQVLTKRPSRVALIANDLTWTPNIWLGTSVESQDYTWRIDKLCQVPATVRFISAEPLLGPLDLRKWFSCCPSCGWPHDEYQSCGYCETYPEVRGLDWVITGAESGHGARPMNEDWVRDIRDQCVERGRAFFYKQNAKNGRKIPLPKLDGKVWNEFPGRVA